jgi:hypothetical protein
MAEEPNKASQSAGTRKQDEVHDVREVGASMQAAGSALWNAISLCADWVTGFAPHSRIAGWTDGVRRFFTEKGYLSFSSSLFKAGQASLVLAEVAILIAGIAAAIKQSAWTMAFVGMGLALMLVVLQYVADRFEAAAQRLVDGWTTRLAGATFPDALAWIFEALGIVIFMTALMSASQASDWSVFWKGVGGWVICVLVAWVLFHPTMQSVEIDPATAMREEAIGIVAYLMKAVLRCVPVVFGVLAIMATVAIISGLVDIFRDQGAGWIQEEIWFGMMATLLPVAAYLAAVFCRLHLDIMHAILSIPGKIDRVAGR